VPADVEAVVVDIGPGLYTGLRVGLATAQALGAAFGIPVVPASSLDALAFEAATAHRKIWSVVDARRGQLAIASYRPVPGGVVKDGATELMTADEFRATLVSEVDDSLVVGDAMVLPDDLLRGIHRVKTGRPRYPSASSLAHVGSGLLDRGEVPRADEIRPLYLREPDVTINWEKLRREGPWDRP
jgi:tRNA threonylcarbamoyladenosine biosynthesis protein TsaB